MFKRNTIKKIVALALIISTAFFIYKVYKEGKKSGTNQIKIEVQEQQIEIQNEIIKEKKQIEIRKAISRSKSSNDNLNWLQTHRCKDCNSK